MYKTCYISICQIVRVYQLPWSHYRASYPVRDGKFYGSDDSYEDSTPLLKDRLPDLRLSQDFDETKKEATKEDFRLLYSTSLVANKPSSVKKQIAQAEAPCDFVTEVQDPKIVEM